VNCSYSKNALLLAEHATNTIEITLKVTCTSELHPTQLPNKSDLW
jgi:hypothetical protein